DKARLYFLLQREHGSGYPLVDLHALARRDISQVKIYKKDYRYHCLVFALAIVLIQYLIS
ncbi:hypothetical protein NWP22_05525, partial [Anabaenopsis tanganyikae CS-531]